jgi:hypothetical protein
MTDVPAFLGRASGGARWRPVSTPPPALLTGRRSSARELRLRHFDGTGAELPLPSWAKHAQFELQALVDLPDRWDGRRAQQVAPRAVEAVIEVLADVMADVTVLPQYFPLPDGGIQVEWHAGEHDVEIEFDSEGSAHLLMNERGHDDVEVDVPAGEFGRLVEQLRPGLHRLTRRVTAAP